MLVRLKISLEHVVLYIAGHAAEMIGMPFCLFCHERGQLTAAVHCSYADRLQHHLLSLALQIAWSSALTHAVQKFT